MKASEGYKTVCDYTCRLSSHITANCTAGSGTMQKLVGSGVRLSAAFDLHGVLEREKGRNVSEPAYYYHTDHLGSTTLLTDSTGYVVQSISYLPYGEEWTEYNEMQRPDSLSLGQYRFNGKERDPESGFLYYGQRYYGISYITMWLSVDPLLDKYPGISPYAYCLWNPVRYVDPDGEDWYEVCNKETGEKEIKWTEWHSQKDLDKNNVDGLYLGTRVVVFAGSLNERLDKDGKLEGDDGIYANITVYGSQENDIGIYRGFTMSSNYELYGAIEDGYYDVVYDERGKTGALPSNYAVEGRNPVGCLNGRNNAWYNKVSGAYSSTQKNGIFVHRTNRSGFAGGNVSTGCPLVRATDWDAFSKQIGNNGFKLILRRTE